MPYMDFHEAFAKRRMMGLLKLDSTAAVITKTGDRTMEPFDGKTAAERKVEDIAKRALDAKEYPTIEKARAAAWLDNPELFDQYRDESHSETFRAKIAKQASERMAKGGHGIQSTAETQLDSLAKKRMGETGEPYAKAYTAVLDTPDGRRLYAEHKAA
ncbi:hypothetical protein [Mesorhizobium sp. B2-7-1]|uniref:hypothetical protein n=1 Tax=Mesorhizobium sp. B2-7-1 TaxID=2589909 RepID=UPI00112BA05F|nr:hypothetical protein [Mesorhizobium sp. B2-7-1]TPJ46844.1 hypothetical protein FJ471_31415 [Mesorhizobium sp. B2-7-1]